MDFMRVFSRNVFNLYDVMVLIFAFNFCRTSGAMFKVVGVAAIGSLILHIYDYTKRKQPSAVIAEPIPEPLG